MFAGAATWLSPVTSTIWNPTETAAQLSQLAKAYDSLVFRAGESSSTQTSANATSYRIGLSVVLTANAWLSPLPGASGLLNGNTQDLASLPEPSLGTSTRASTGLSAVGRASLSLHPVVMSPRGRATRRSDGAGRSAGTAWARVPPSQAWIGRYVPACGHHRKASPATRAAASRPERPRWTGLPFVRWRGSPPPR